MSVLIILCPVKRLPLRHQNWVTLLVILSRIRGVEAQGISLHDLVARIGARVVAEIRSTAEELLHDPRSLGGMLNPDDVIPIE